MQRIVDIIFGQNCLPNEYCYLWPRIVTDILIGLAYFSIPISLFVFSRKKNHSFHKWHFALLTTFILLCATTHFLSVYTIWNPLYLYELILKLLTAILLIIIAIVVSKSTWVKVQSKNDLIDKVNLNQQKENYLKTQNAYWLAPIFDQSTDAILVNDLSGKIIQWNRSAEKLYGHNKNEMIGEYIWKIIPTQYVEEIKNYWKMLKNNEVVKPFETKRISKNGKLIEISLTLFAVKDSFGNVIGYCSIARNISEFKKLNFELIKKERFLKAIIQSIPTGIISVDSAGKIIMVNESIEQMFKYDEGELIGKFVEDIIPNQLRSIHIEHRNNYQKSPTNKQMGVGRDLTGLTKDGQEISVEVGLAPVKFEHSSETIASIVNISERKEFVAKLEREHKRLKEVLELNTDGWWDLDLKNPEEEYLSPSFKKLFGYKDHELENKSETWKKLIFPEDLEKALKNFKKHIDSDGKSPYFQKVRYKHKNGSTIWVICKGIGLKDEKGNFDRMIGIHFDITKQVKLENKLKKINKNLILQKDEMEQLVYSISHDLKSPLVTCMSFLQFLKEDYSNKDYDQLQESITEIEDAVKRMRSLIEDILELSRVGHMELNESLIDFNEIIDSVKSKLKNNGILKSIPREVSFEVSPNIPSVIGDASKVKQVFENLINNAIKYGCNENTNKINIYYKTVKNKLRICVQDFGQGVDRRYHKKVFQFFQRLESDKEGTGVGLTIVSKIMQLHEGRAWLESSLGKGASFWIEFPMKMEVLDNEKEF